MPWHYYYPLILLLLPPLQNATHEQQQTCFGGGQFPQNSGVEGDNGELVDLPRELRKIKDNVFDFQDELEAKLVKPGFPYLPVVIDPKTRKARLRITSGAHNTITRRYSDVFNTRWASGTCAIADGTNAFIQEASNYQTQTRHCPLGKKQVRAHRWNPGAKESGYPST